MESVMGCSHTHTYRIEQILTVLWDDGENIDGLTIIAIASYIAS